MNALTLQFLEWVAQRPRTYAQAMDAWRSTCPRLTIWEDALNDGLIEMHQVRVSAHDVERRARGVRLSERGRLAMQSAMNEAAMRAHALKDEVSA